MIIVEIKDIPSNNTLWEYLNNNNIQYSYDKAAKKSYGVLAVLNFKD